MGRPYTILIADYVPLANRGEEAIVRGIADLLGRGRPVRLGLFDAVVQPTTLDNITVFPWPWIFRAQGNRALTGRRRALLDILMALRLRLGWHGRLANMVNPAPTAMAPLRDFFAAADLVLVGHDGVFCTESCGVIHLAKRAGKRVGILGASAGLGPRGRWYKGPLYARALRESDFVVLREAHARDSLAAVAPHLDCLHVAPDPAFAMEPIDGDGADALLASYPVYAQARRQGRPVIAVSVLEAGRVFAAFRPDLPAAARREAHAAYLAGLLDGLARRTGALLVFLAHAREPDASDLDAARRVAAQLRVDRAQVLVVDHDLDARSLKGLIARCDFLVAERTHALVAAVSTGTPFVGLTASTDTRTHGMIGDLCRCADLLLDIDAEPADAVIERLALLWEDRRALTDRLTEVRLDIEADLQVLAHLVLGVGAVY